MGGKVECGPARPKPVLAGSPRTIVNLGHVESTSRDLAGRVSLTLKTRQERVVVSRAFAHLFKQM